jgi:uncharacterized membrane protein
MTTLSSRLVAAIVTVAVTATMAVPAYAGFTCNGTEPFWNLTVNKGLVFDSANDGTTNYSKATLKWVGATRLYTASGAGKPTVKTAIRANNACSDGMSDDIYPYEVTVSVTGKATLRGCCRKW